MRRRPSVRPAVIGVAAFLVAGPASAFSFSQWISAVQQKLSSYRVLTKQIGVSSDKIAMATVQSFSAGATAIVANRQATQVREAVQRFSDQGIFPCFGTDVSQITGMVRLKTGVAVRNASARISGWDLGGPVVQQSDATILHRNVYCSVSEHMMGFCKVNTVGLQSADSDFSLIVKPGTKSSSERGASYDYVDNILAQNSGEATCNSPDCVAQAVDARSFNSFASLSRLSFLSTIESRSQQSATPNN